MHDEQLTVLVEKMLKHDEFKFLFSFLQENGLDALRYAFCEQTFLNKCDELNITVVCGASRVVIIPKNSNYVYKVNVDDADQNYCQMEYDVFKAAERAGVHYAFARMEKVDAIPFCFKFPTHECLIDMANDMKGLSVTEAIENFDDDWDEFSGTLDFYRAQKIPAPFCSNCSVSGYGIKISMNSPLAERHCDIGERFWRDYGTAVYSEISSILNKYRVNDIHSGNVGFYHGRIVLLDYCGYYSY